MLLPTPSAAVLLPLLGLSKRAGRRPQPPPRAACASPQTGLPLEQAKTLNSFVTFDTEYY